MKLHERQLRGGGNSVPWPCCPVATAQTAAPVSKIFWLHFFVQWEEGATPLFDPREQQKDESEAERGERRKAPLPAAPACGLTVTWPAEGEDRAAWSRPSAPGTTALNLAWRGEAYCPQPGTGERTEEQQGEAEGEKRRQEIRKHSHTARRGWKRLFYTP